MNTLSQSDIHSQVFIDLFPLARCWGYHSEQDGPYWHTENRVTVDRQVKTQVFFHTYLLSASSVLNSKEVAVNKTKALS